MRTAHAAVVLGGFVGLLAAQDPPAAQGQPVQAMRLMAQVLDGSALAKFDANGQQVANGSAVTRLNELLLRIAAGGVQRGAGALLRIARSTRGDVLLARGTTDQIELAQAVLAQLARDDLPRLRLQCTLLTLPAAVAGTHGLKPNAVVATDVAAAGRLARDAIKHHGTLHNLPEVTAAPLAPFTVASPGRTKGEGATPLQVCGEMLPVAADQVAVAMRLVRPAAAGAERPDTALGDAVFRLRAGESAMAMIVDGQSAVVLVVRCVDLSRQAPAAAPPTGR